MQQAFLCYRCGAATQRVTASDPAPVTGEFIIPYECPQCGQRYEIQWVPIAVFALSATGQAQAHLQRCPQCGTLYQLHEIHMCQDAGEVREPVEQQEAPLLSQPLFRIFLLGQLKLERRLGQRWQNVTARVVQEQDALRLLTCLVSSPGRAVSRVQTLTLLWPTLTAEVASHRLDQAVHALRQLLEPARPYTHAPQLLFTDQQSLRLTNQSSCWLDADAFEAVLANAYSSTDPTRREQLLEEAMRLYRGDYLPGEQEASWTQARRESLHLRWVGLLLELADLRVARGATLDAMELLDRLLAFDPANEAAVQRLLRLLVQAGRHDEATAVYERFARMLQEEYQLVPLTETTSLLRKSMSDNSGQS